MKWPGKIALLAVAAIVIVPYLAAGWNELPVDDTFREQAPGAFVQLSDGQVHYRWLGDASDEIIVLVHGISVPQYVFVQTGAALVESGYRVLLFDLFGHGYSDRPAVDYDPEFFRRQMIELFDELGLDAPIHIGALSMGGVIAMDFAAYHPERVRSLTLIAPAGLRLVNEKESNFSKLMKSPVIGHWLWRIVAPRVFFQAKSNSATKVAEVSPEKLQGVPARQADHEGFFAAMRQIFRFLPLSHRDDLLLTINETKIPVLGIFGDTDETIHPGSAALLGRLIPRARVEMLAGGTHHLIIHRWRDVHEAMVSFVKDQRHTAE
jgi:pimeloyl-ACP methyl ester carboxylesterase